MLKMASPNNPFDTEYLNTMTLAKLKNEAAYYNLQRYSSLRKDALLEKLKAKILYKKKEAEMEEAEQACILKAEEEHRLTRDTSLRQQEDPDDAWLEYPYSFLADGYIEYPMTLVCQEEPEDIGDFPNNVDQYYWIHEGANDEEPWITLCKLRNGVYVFYKGECDYTGFDCQGSMELYASKNPSELIEYAMTISDYRLYILETSPNDEQ